MRRKKCKILQPDRTQEKVYNAKMFNNNNDNYYNNDVYHFVPN